MKRFLAFVVAVIGLGMMMSGCVANVFKTTKVEDSYIQKNYIDKVKVPESKRVGDKEIKFYVGKVEDKREDKAVVIKRGPFLIRTASTKFANPELSIRHITEKALFNTGWGVVENRDRADFVVETKLKDFGQHWGFFSTPKRTESEICLYDKNNKRFLSKNIARVTAV
ncbi:hypothetical protein [Hippea sp. KM1]|uniref:hypothetical protein n=1 Tax=Hippea sp. KM1 TaxID=944481 RepID=UPI00046D01CA|nr:hypothetical protein [Hippea sp. KM1]